MRTRTQSCKGFTLIELIVTIVLVGILASAGTGLVTNSYKMNQLVSDETVALADARYAIERITREAREISLDTNGVPNVSTAEISTFAFSKNEIAYEIKLSDKQILFSKGNVTGKILLDNVDNLTFTYFYDDNGTFATTTDKSKVRAAKIEFSMGSGVLSKPVHMVTYVALRNT